MVCTVIKKALTDFPVSAFLIFVLSVQFSNSCRVSPDEAPSHEAIMETGTIWEKENSSRH
jgi:hypothetical protein